ncbi:reverse transcriptase [Lithospermum erythrorhizon]|uniref:Reverse transcriptase n=1 Tax=Lithospermum erythrorhizon TaxID=34254 RepID=A0AAV3P6G2_LITER
MEVLMDFFSSTRGLRQGDPLSPYLFIIIMDMFNELLNHRALHSEFTFHPKCKELGIANVCFADDTFILYGAFGKTIEIVNNALKDFSEWYGLKPNLDKSTMYIARLELSRAQGLSSKMGIAMGSLPVKYRGMTLITKQLTYGDCRPLNEGITKKIEEWGNHHLSFAGMFVLINSVVFGKENYWCQSIYLHVVFIKKIEQIVRCFLWKGEAHGSYMPKVSWKNVAMGEKRRWIGYKRLEDLESSLYGISYVGPLQ